MSDHFLHLAARAMGVTPLRPRARLRFEPEADGAATGAPTLEATVPERATADRDPLATRVANDRVTFERPDAAVETQRASRRARQPRDADEGVEEESPSGSASGPPAPPVDATRGHDVESERPHRSSTRSGQDAAPPIRPTVGESSIGPRAKRDTEISVDRALHRPSDDLADSTNPVAPRRSAATIGDRVGAAATSEEPAPMDATPSVARRHRFDVRSPREAMLAESVGRREPELRANERGRGDVWSRDPAHARQPHADRVTRPAEPVVHVSIGRIEVRATTPAAPPRAAERRHSPMSIDDYVARGRAR